MRHLSTFVCQTCDLVTKSVSRAVRHKMSHESHEVFELSPLTTPTPTTTEQGARDE